MKPHPPLKTPVLTTIEEERKYLGKKILVGDTERSPLEVSSTETLKRKIEKILRYFEEQVDAM